MFNIYIEQKFKGVIAGEVINDEELFMHLKWVLNDIETILRDDLLSEERQNLIVNKLIRLYDYFLGRMPMLNYEVAIHTTIEDRAEELRRCIEEEYYDTNLSIFEEIFLTELSEDW